MRPALFALVLAACGAEPTPPAPCPTAIAEYAPCADSEVASERCSFGIVYVCEPTIATCYGGDVDAEGHCPTAPDGGPFRPELVGAHWLQNGWCP